MNQNNTDIKIKGAKHPDCLKIWEELIALDPSDVVNYGKKNQEFSTCMISPVRESYVSENIISDLYGDFQDRFLISQKNTRNSNFGFALRESYFDDKWTSYKQSLEAFKQHNKTHPYYKSIHDMSLNDPTNKINIIGAGGGGSNLSKTNIYFRVSTIIKDIYNIGLLTDELFLLSQKINKQQLDVSNEDSEDSTTPSEVEVYKVGFTKKSKDKLKTELDKILSSQRDLVYSKISTIKNHLDNLFNEKINLATASLTFKLTDTNSSDLNSKLKEIKEFLVKFNGRTLENGDIKKEFLTIAGVPLDIDFSDIFDKFKDSLSYLHNNFSSHFYETFPDTSWGNISNENRQYVFKKVGKDFFRLKSSDVLENKQDFKVKYDNNKSVWPYFYSKLDLFEKYELDYFSFDTIAIPTLEYDKDTTEGYSAFVNKNKHDLSLPKEPLVQSVGGTNGAGGNIDVTLYGTKYQSEKKDSKLLKNLGLDFEYSQKSNVKELIQSNILLFEAFQNPKKIQYAPIVELLREYPSHLLLCFTESYVPKVLELFAGLNGGSGTGIIYSLLESIEKYTKDTPAQRPLIYIYFYQNLIKWVEMAGNTLKVYQNADLVFKAHKSANVINILSEDRFKSLVKDDATVKANVKLDLSGLGTGRFVENTIGSKYSINKNSKDKIEDNDMKDIEVFSNSKSIVIPFKVEFTQKELDEVKSKALRNKNKSNIYLDSVLSDGSSEDFNNSQVNLPIQRDFDIDENEMNSLTQIESVRKYIAQKIWEFYSKTFSIINTLDINYKPAKIAGKTFYTSNFLDEYTVEINDSIRTELLNAVEGNKNYTRIGSEIIPVDSDGSEKFIAELVVSLDERLATKAMIENLLTIVDLVWRVRDPEIKSKVQSVGKNRIWERYLNISDFEYKSIELKGRHLDYFTYHKDLTFHCPYDFVKNIYLENTTSTNELKYLKFIDFIDVHKYKPRYNCPNLNKDLEDSQKSYQLPEDSLEIEVNEDSHQALINELENQNQSQKPKKFFGKIKKFFS